MTDLPERFDECQMPDCTRPAELDLYPIKSMSLTAALNIGSRRRVEREHVRVCGACSRYVVSREVEFLERLGPARRRLGSA